MDYPDAEGLIQTFKTNHWLVHQLVNGLNQEDSIVQPPYEGNCLNWVLGHIVVSRHRVLSLLNEAAAWNDGEIGQYDTGSDPITGDNQGKKLEDLLTAFDLVQDRIENGLGAISDQDFNLEVETSRGIKPVGKHIAGRSWHETYHIGQLELLRALALANRV